jgi:8-oxo-dGTP pyrophosphatase MutT (NUDIX family)
VETVLQEAERSAAVTLVDPGDTPEETALNEAWEEAGLRGRLIGDVVGTYEYEKWNTTFAVTVYLMEVLEPNTACSRRRPAR